MIGNVRAVLPALLCVSVLTLAGCGSKSATDTEMKADNGDAMGVEEPLVTEKPAITISEGRTSAPMLPVYFEFDSSDIRGDQVSRIQVNADFLKESADTTIRIEGNTDPRGTKEYNLALGEKRAINVRDYLIDLGVEPGKIRTVSYGEERPLFFEQTDFAWSQNRRADFVIE